MTDEPTSTTPDLSIGPGHTPADEHLAHLQLARSFLSGPHADDSIMQLRWYVCDDDGSVVGRVWWGPGAQGPPGHAHGGSMAAILDEALGSACWVAGHAVVAAKLDTTFREMLPLNAVYTVTARVERVDGRKIHPTGEICDDAGKIYACATGLFIEMDRERFRTLAAGS